MKKRLLAISLVLALVLAMLPTTALADDAVTDSGTCGESLTWNLINGVLTISGTGEMTDYKTPNDYTDRVRPSAPWSASRNNVTTLVVEEGVTSIGSNAFYYFHSLESVSLPSTLRTIHANAFYNISKFQGLTLPDGLETLESRAFADCTYLRWISLPESLVNFSSSAFTGCLNINSAYYRGNLDQWQALDIRFDQKVRVYPQRATPDDPAGICLGTCGDMEWLCMDGVLRITGTGYMPAFSTNNSSTLPPWPSENVTSIVIGSGINSVGANAFAYCDDLVDVTLPDTVEVIGDCAFYWCASLQRINLPNGLLQIGSEAFFLSSITELSIPSSVTSIGERAFGSCRKLTSIKLPDVVTSIETSTFYDCSALVAVSIPSGIISIGESAFGGCNALADVYYSGNETQWSAISVGGNNDPLKKATIHYNSSGEITSYTVTYDLDDGSNGPSAQSYTAGATVTVPDTVPTKNNYTFGGWSDGNTTYQPGDTFTMPDHDVTLTAIWKSDVPLPGGITALYPANGSTFDYKDSTADTRMRIFFDREVSNAGGNRPELDFSVGSLEVHKSSDDSVVYQVQYGTEVSHWNVDGRSTAVVLQNASAALAAGTEYYVTMPAGFIKMADGSSSPAIGENDWRFTTKASPQAGNHNLTYDYNDGTYGPFPATSHTVGETITVSSTKPTREGYKFGGWADGGTIYKPGDTFKMPDRDVTLTAVWKVAYTVTYDLNGGTGDIPAEHWAEGEKFPITAQVPTKVGRYFDHWSYGNNSYRSGTSFTMPGEDVTLKAEWITESAEMQYVKHITGTSLTGVTETVKQSIQNGIYNLLFKATFRPTAGPAIPGIPAKFTDSGELPNWYPQNCHGYANKTTVTDDDLNATRTFEGSAGCKAYALFAMNYIYSNDARTEKPGNAIPFNKINTTPNDLKILLEDHMLPGAMIYYNHANGNHAIVYLGEDEDNTGFYYISYEGGSNGPNTIPYHQMTVKFDKFEEFYKKFNYFYARDQHGSLDAARTIIRVECPVEARVIFGNEVLDSRNAPASNSFGNVYRDGEAIIFDLEYNESYRLEIIGTGEGTMDLTVEYQDENGDTLNTRGFENIPIENDAQIDSYGFDASGVFILYQNLGEDDEKIWGASINQTVSEPDEMFSSKYNASDLRDNPDTSTDYTISVQPSSAAGTTDIQVNGQASATAHEGNTVVVTPAAAEPGKRLNVTAAAGSSSVDVTDNGDGTYSFTMPAANVTVTVNAVNVYALTLTQPAALAGSAALDKTTAAVGDTVTVTVTPSTGFECIGIAVLNDGKQNVSVFENKDAAGKIISYYFKIPANPKNMEVIPIMQASTTAACVYSNSGSFGGQLSFSNLTVGSKYVVQVAKAKDAAHAIMFFTAKADGTAVVDVLRNPSGYVVDLFVYDKAITVTPSYDQLTTVPITVTTAK